ncbi:unnamed protein product, partial [marine sediment metagenome]
SFLVQDLCQNFGSEFLENIRKRYWLLTTPQLDIFVVPNEKKILEKLVWPLRAAKKAFILSDYLGCIALCGMVCEMAIIFLFDLAAIHVNTKPLNTKQQRQIFGSTFEKLGQEKRIQVLYEIELLSGELAKDADAVRKIRRQYLHFLSKSYSRIEKDAEDAYKASFQLIKSLVDLPVGNDGKLIIPEHLTNYLSKRLNKKSDSV